MKKLVILSLSVLAFTLSFTSCSSDNTPGGALKSYVSALNDGDYEEFVDGVYFNERMSERRKEKQRAQLLSLARDKGTSEFDQKGGLVRLEILSEEISEDGESAIVKYKRIFGNGEEESGKQKMVKRDDKWLMDMRK